MQLSSATKQHDHSHAQTRFAVIPTPLRLGADSEYTGKGCAIAFLDSGFYPHPDLIQPENQMTMVLNVSNRMNVARYTGLFAGALVATYIGVEAPLSGMSLNPARTFGSAYNARIWNALWIYFTAPPLGMLLAAECYLRLKGARVVLCAKLHHHNHERCIFKCNFGACSQTVTAAADSEMSSMPS